MEGEVKENIEHKDRKLKRRSVSITLTGIPMSVHERINDYKRDINAKRRKDLNLKQAYVEWLKETTKPKSL